MHHARINDETLIRSFNKKYKIYSGNYRSKVHLHFKDRGIGGNYCVQQRVSVDRGVAHPPHSYFHVYKYIQYVSNSIRSIFVLCMCSMKGLQLT